jgi:putative ABC transport system substrate-binding protein
VDIPTPDEIAVRVETGIQSDVDAILVISSGMFWNERVQIVTAVAKHQIPAIYPEPEYAHDGGLIAYGPDVSENFRGAAIYVDKILKGARPGDLPIVQPTKFPFILNLKTAKALGLTFPPSLLARADEIIE